jgi:hypothetical protein
MCTASYRPVLSSDRAFHMKKQLNITINVFKIISVKEEEKLVAGSRR